MFINLKLNAKLQPTHRFDLEDTLQEILENNKLGEVTGGGTALTPEHEVDFCDINIELNNDDADVISWLAQVLNEIGIAKGSLLQFDGKELPVGTLEGLAIYLNGTDLPDEVYQNSDINYVVDEMEKAMEGTGRLYSYWEGPSNTALYFYGTSFAEMKEKTAKFVAAYPLCEKCIIKQIA